MSKLSYNIRNLILNIYDDNKNTPYDIINTLVNNYSNMRNYMSELLKLHSLTENAQLIDLEISEITDIVLLINPSKYLKDSKCPNNTARLLTSNEINTYYLLYKFQERVFNVMQNETMKIYINILIELYNALGEIHPYSHFISSINEINTFILKEEYDIVIKNMCEKLEEMNNKYKIVFGNNTIKIIRSNTFFQSCANDKAFKIERYYILQTIAEIIKSNSLECHIFATLPNIAKLFMDWKENNFN